MRSATAVTFELDDINLAVSELEQQIKSSVQFGAESIGILYGQADMDIGGVSALLHQRLGIDIIGGTTSGGISMSDRGFCELALVLHVMTADDCKFTAAFSPPIRKLSDVTEFYKEAEASSGQNELPKIIMCSMCNLRGISTDDLHAKLCESAGRQPVFGFVAGDDFEHCKQQVYLNDKIGGDCMVLLLVYGNVMPVFAVKNLAGSQALAKRLVTKTRGNVIVEIDGKPAYEYIKEFPFIGDANDGLWSYQFFAEMQSDPRNDGVLVSRVMNTYDEETGEISCYANIPEGSHISLQYCEGKDVQKSCSNALETITANMSANKGYKYSTAFVVSCSIRGMLLADQRHAESELVRNALAPSLTYSGVYAYGEIAPTSIRNGRAVNRYHNATICICAF